jgi:FKBP-type peptidyl-prolyl cis-trans isomerase FkpA
LPKNKLNAIKTGTWLYYVINESDWDQPKATSNVPVAYKGYFTNGSVFDEKQTRISFGLNQVIKGWTEGIPFFKR